MAKIDNRPKEKDAISGNASHANLMELLGIRKGAPLVLNTNYTN